MDLKPLVIETLFSMLTAGVTPRVPEKGSVGASGDLAPLAHLALAMIGEGQCFYKGGWVKSCEALRASRNRSRCGSRRKKDWHY